MDVDVIERGIRELQRRGEISEPKYKHAFVIVLDNRPTRYNTAMLVKVVAVYEDSKQERPQQTHSTKSIDLCVMPRRMATRVLFASGVLIAIEDGWEITHATDTCVYMRKKIDG